MGSVGQQFVHIEAGFGVSAAAALFGGRPPPLLGDLEKLLRRDVLPRLTLPPVAPPPIASAEIAAFAGLARANDRHGAMEIATALRARGHAFEAICDGLLAPAARHVGELWTDDACDCVEVTVAAGVIYQVLRDLAPPVTGSLSLEARSAGRTALLVPVPGEQHMLGLAMVCARFRSAGWGVRTFTPDMAALAAALRAEPFAVIGLSLGSDGRLETLRAAIRMTRETSRNPDIGVLVGGKLFADTPDLAREIGADSTAADADDAVRQAERLLRTVPALA